MKLTKDQSERYQRFLKENLAQQINSSFCGLAALENAIKLMFGEKISQRSLCKYKYYATENGSMTEGMPPESLALLIHYLDRKIFKRNLKVFVSQHGTISQLSYLLAQNIYPIIHRSFHEGEKEGHYELVLATDNEQKEVCLFNSARRFPTSRVYVKNYQEFTDSWWPNFSNKERWYLAITPESMKLPHDMFKGKYL
jgi:hypothetical protein